MLAAIALGIVVVSMDGDSWLKRLAPDPDRVAAIWLLGRYITWYHETS